MLIAYAMDTGVATKVELRTPMAGPQDAYRGQPVVPPGTVEIDVYLKPGWSDIEALDLVREALEPMRPAGVVYRYFARYE
jgi:hypothetical protein